MGRCRFALLFLALGASLPASAAPVPTGSGGASLSPDERTLKAVHLPLSGPALLEFFRKQTHAEADPQRLASLVEQLRAPRPTARQHAVAELVTAGIPAVPYLRQAANSLDDLEAAGRAKLCLQYVEGPSAPALLSAAARLLAVRKPPDAAAVLLAYLPFAVNEAVAREVETALAAVAFRDGKLEPALLKALDDPVPVRRGAAAATLCQVGSDEHREAVRRLLKDPKPAVRLRAALGLAHRNDATVIPLLIDLLLELPAAERLQVETYLRGLAGEWQMYVPQGEDAVTRRLRRDLWAAWWRNTEGPAVLDEVRRRTLPDGEREHWQALIRRLADESLSVRQQAEAELLALGGIPVSLYQQALHDPDPRVRQYVSRCPHLLDKKTPQTLPAAALRLITLRRPPGTTEALLAYLPCAESEALIGQVQTALAAVAFTHGQPDPALVRGLGDKVARRRIAAAELLYEHGTDEHRAAARKLFRDPDAQVRLRVAQAAVERFDKAAVPVLIGLLAELPVEQGAEVEEYLHYLAGDKAPNGELGPDPSGRRRCRDAWQHWWKQHGPALDLAKHDGQQRAVGKTVIVEQHNPGTRTGRVLVVDAAGQTLWQIESLQSPSDAVLLAADRVLVAEQNARLVTERDAKGTVLWQKQFTSNNFPIGCQRLANGNTFITCNNRLVEVDRTGKEVFDHTRQSYDIAAARKLRNGQAVFLTNTGTYVRLDARGKPVKTFQLVSARQQYYGYRVFFLPNDHVVVPQDFGSTKLVEYDGQGRPFLEIPMPGVANAVARLPNGHLLITNMGTQTVTQLDRKGRTVWEYKDPSVRPSRARRAEALSP
jgi:HEAT repeat protein